MDKIKKLKIVTAGSTYLDIDAYACAVALTELLREKGENAIAYSDAPCNYSVCSFLTNEDQVIRALPEGILLENADYIIVDVSDPKFLVSSVPLDKVVEIYDHHVGFEEYWTSKIGKGAHIEFIGAAATLIYREWKRAGLHDKMTRSTALLLIAAILDNTLNLTSSNTTNEDIVAFEELCKRAGIDKEWCASYFSEVQKSVEADLKNAIFKDIKFVRDNPVLPLRVGQICVWNTERVLSNLEKIRELFCDVSDSWMINIIDIKNRCSYFLCDDADCQKKIEKVFGISFVGGIAKTQSAYLRKEIIKKTLL